MALLVALGTSVGLAGCRSGDAQRPGVAPTSDVRAQEELRALEDEWEVGSVIARRALRGRLLAFVETYTTDPSVSRARVMLAQVALSEGKVQQAEDFIAPVLAGPPGRHRDEANVVMAGVENRRDQPEEALRRLDPLKGKLLTEEARHAYSKERVAASLKARRWREAVNSMVIWVAESEHQAKEARDWSREALRQVPSSALARLLVDWDDDESLKDGARSQRQKEAGRWLLRVIIDDLTHEALSKKDARLARDLLDHSPSWLRASEAGDELSLLAALVEEKARVSGLTVGVVLGGASEASRQESVRVAFGLLRGLSVSAESSSDNGAEAAPAEGTVRLLAEEYRGSMTAALASLSGQGAAILVAGVDEASAHEALSFAETRKIPVIVLAHPPSAIVDKLAYGFIAGPGPAEEEAALTVGLTGLGAKEVRMIGTAESPCPAFGSPLPLSNWKEAGVDAVGVLGDASCGAAVQRALVNAKFVTRLGVGLEASVGPYLPKAPQEYFFLGAGQYPAAQERAPKDVYTASETLNRRPVLAFHAELGRDLARLLLEVFSALPTSVATEPSAVRKWHDQARDALLKAEVDLSTTSARGFSGRHALGRALELRPLAGVTP